MRDSIRVVSSAFPSMLSYVIVNRKNKAKDDRYPALLVEKR